MTRFRTALSSALVLVAMLAASPALACEPLPPEEQLAYTRDYIGAFVVVGALALVLAVCALLGLGLMARKSRSLGFHSQSEESV